jgi:hypothetical protein
MTHVMRQEAKGREVEEERGEKVGWEGVVKSSRHVGEKGG